MTDAQRRSPMLEARDITLKFGGVTALSQISVDIGHQELVALIGPNGAGKSSLLNVLSGFYRPSEGSVRFEGQDIGRWPVHRVAQAGLARTFQGTHLLPPHECARQHPGGSVHAHEKLADHRFFLLPLCTP